MVNASLMNRLNNSLAFKAVGEPKENITNYKEQILKSLQIGDILEGTLINKTESGYVLELNSGIHIPVFLLDEMEVGKLLQFKVESNMHGELHLSTNKESIQNFTQKVIQELGLTHTPQIEECVNQFMAKELPLTKENLLSTHYLHKQYHMPTEVMINTLAKSNQLTEKDIQSLFKIKAYGIDHIMKEIKQTILQIEDINEQFKVLETLSKQLPREERSVVLQKIMQDILKQANGVMAIEDNLTSIEAEQKWINITKYLAAESEWTSNSKVEIENILRQDNNFYRQGLKLFISKVYNQVVGIDVKKSKEPLQEQLVRFSRDIFKVVEHSEIDKINEMGKDAISTLKQGAQVLQKLNTQGDYFIFPFINNDVLNKGEIYFFEPRKQVAKGEKNTYIVIALDLSMLNHLEIHINKIKNKLSLNIMVETEDIKHHIIKYIDRLWQEIKDMGYQLEKCTYTLQDQKIYRPISSYIEQKITAFDMKV